MDDKVKQRIVDSIDALIDRKFNTSWHYEDFVDAYKDYAGIDEDRDLTEDEMYDLMDQLDATLDGFRDVVIEDTFDRMRYIFD